MNVIPFICSACGVEFYHSEGGPCAVCGRLFCAIDLYEIKEDNKTIHVCKGCKGDKPGKPGKNEALSVRRKLILMRRKKE
jgi:hypothetical protein